MSTVEVNERVEGILRAACRVIAQDGAHGLRMEAVAREAGVSKALVHYYFATRRDLLREAFAYAENRARRQAQAELDLLASGAERLERFLVLHVEGESAFRESRALWNEVWSSMQLDEELRPGVEQAYRAWTEWVADLVREGQSDGSIPSGLSPDETALRLTALSDGLDSLLLLGLITREHAGALVRESIGLELGAGRV